MTRVFLDAIYLDSSRWNIYLRNAISPLPEGGSGRTSRPRLFLVSLFVGLLAAPDGATRELVRKIRKEWGVPKTRG
jgi:hypothetical protein